MFRGVLLIGFATGLGAAIYVACGSETAPTDPFIVHEWGTFTSMQGTDGEALQGLHHETERLPDFVHSRTESIESPYRRYGDTSYQEQLQPGVMLRNIRTKMETPVLYFYSATQRRVNVTVEYVGGWMTQWFPQTTAVEPQSTLVWDVDVLPAPEGLPDVPEVGEDTPWAWARNTGAATVRTNSGETERYLFYRGLGGSHTAVVVAVHLDGNIQVTNTTGWRIPAAFVVDMSDDTARFYAIGALAAGDVRLIPLGNSEYVSPDDAVKQLEVAVLDALVESGLYEDEASVMVRTWTPTWFEARGTRVVYIVPRAQVDAILPIEIDPLPDELVRVIVGRQEYLTARRHAEIALALHDIAAVDSQRIERGRKQLARQGRFLEASVRAVMAAHPQDRNIQLGGYLALEAY